jgi:branched-chain amino acid transport system ATP-binding protein
MALVLSDRSGGMMDLAIEGVGVRFGGLWANRDISFGVRPGSITAVIGPNGAGKSTLFNVVTGFLKPTEGQVRLDGELISGRAPENAARLGIGRTFQIPEICHDLTVLENVLVGAHRHIKGGLFAQVLGFGQARDSERLARERAAEELERVGLAGQGHLPAGGLPLGKVRLLEIARALASNPRLLLLDETASGLNAREVAGLSELIRSLPARGMTVLLIEHNVRFVMELAESVAVLDHGQLLAVGPPDVVRADERVLTAYLGKRRR